MYTTSGYLLMNSDGLIVAVAESLQLIGNTLRETQTHTHSERERERSAMTLIEQRAPATQYPNRQLGFFFALDEKLERRSNGDNNSPRCWVTWLNRLLMMLLLLLLLLT